MSERILVVDDDDRIAAIVRDGLTSMSYRVELAADGPAALAAMRAQMATRIIVAGGDPSHNEVERRYGSGAMSAFYFSDPTARLGRTTTVDHRRSAALSRHVRFMLCKALGLSPC